MPIIGLTDRQPSFPRIGILRKGAPKPQRGPGRDLHRFRFTSSDKEAAHAFEFAYGREPQSVRLFFPYPTADENFEAWMEEWGSGGLVHRCDGRHVVLMHEGESFIRPVEVVPCPYASGEKQRTRFNPGCKQIGRLKVIVPELARLAYVLVLTGSIYDIVELHANLLAYERLRGDLRGIPFILKRVPRQITMPVAGGGRGRREAWLLHLEAAPLWVEAQLETMERRAMPRPADGEKMALLTAAGALEPDEELAVAAEGDTDLDPHLAGDAEYAVLEAEVETVQVAASLNGHNGFVKPTPFEPGPWNGDVDPKWRQLLQKNPRPTVATVCTLLPLACTYYRNEGQVYQMMPELDKPERLSTEAAGALFDRLIEQARQHLSPTTHAQ